MDQYNSLIYYLSFSHCYGIGPMKFRALVNHFKTPEKAYKAKSEELKNILGIKLGEKFIDFRNRFNPEKILQEITAKKITVITQESKYYPPQLLQIPDPPICLYVKGDITQFDFNNQPCFAIVGTRKPTTYGEQIAKKFSKELTESGFIIVSGMAIGIDTIAHQNCLDSYGKTIAFLGCGVDVIYPAINTQLYYRIIDQKGLIISEFPPGHTVLPGLFISRNRLISGLSMGSLVVEGAKDSGAMITARYAGEQGKEVFAVPSPLTSVMGEAPNFLLKQGAKLVTSIEDILEEFNMKLVPKKKQDITKLLNEEERKLFNCLHPDPKSPDEIVAELQIPINQILNLLSILEIKGVVEKNGEGKYIISIH